MMSDAQTEQLARVLKLLIRFSKIQNQELEKKLGFSGGYMSRLLSGRIDIKISHVLDIADSLGMLPQEIFSIAFPASSPGPSPGLRNVHKMLPHLAPAATPATPPPPAQPPFDVDKLHRKLEDSLSETLDRVFGDLEKQTAFRR
jgi:hypothetical protein